MRSADRALAALVLVLLFFISGCASSSSSAPLEARIYRYGANGETAGTPAAANGAYRPDRQIAAHRSALAVADSTTIDATFFATVTAFVTGGRQNIPVSARFSAASQTCVIRLVAANKDPSTGTYYLCGISDPVTLTGSSILDSGGKRIAPTYVFDSFGASNLCVQLITAPGSGTVDFWVGSY